MGHGHDHGVSATTDRRRLGIALTLLLGFAVAEVVTGLLAGSVALLADAGHMTADAAALALALVAIGLAARPPARALPSGLKRAARPPPPRRRADLRAKARRAGQRARQRRDARRARARLRRAGHRAAHQSA